MSTQWLIRIALITPLVLFLIAPPASGQTGLEIIKKQKELLKTQDEFVLLQMVLVEPPGQKKERKLVLYAKTDKTDLSKILIRFLSPRDVEGIGLLMVEKKAGEYDLWYYLPATGKARRIASSGKKNHIPGTDFSFEDLIPDPIDAYEYKLLGSETCDGKPCYVVEALPKTDREKQERGSSRLKFWILKDNYFSIRREVYDHNGNLEQIQRSSELKFLGGTVWRANIIEMEKVKKPTKMMLRIEERKTNQGLSEQLFAERELTKGK